MQSQREHYGPMTKRVTTRPQPFKKPEGWSNDPPPKPAKVPAPTDPLDPTRYGDWEKNGIAVDF